MLVCGTFVWRIGKQGYSVHKAKLHAELKIWRKEGYPFHTHNHTHKYLPTYVFLYDNNKRIIQLIEWRIYMPMNLVIIDLDIGLSLNRRQAPI